jgi:hypothetical protein
MFHGYCRRTALSWCCLLTADQQLIFVELDDLERLENCNDEHQMSYVIGSSLQMAKGIPLRHLRVTDLGRPVRHEDIALVQWSPCDLDG